MSDQGSSHTVRVDRFVVDERVLMIWDGKGWMVTERLPEDELAGTHRIFVAAVDINETAEAFAVASEFVDRLRAIEKARQDWLKMRVSLDEWALQVMVETPVVTIEAHNPNEDWSPYEEAAGEYSPAYANRFPRPLRATDRSNRPPEFA